MRRRRLFVGAFGAVSAIILATAIARRLGEAELELVRPVGGAVVHDAIPPRGTNVWVFRLAGLRATSMHSDAGRRLECRVFDPAGVVVEGGVACDRSWLPSRTGAYRVEVSNPHRGVVTYTLSINVDSADVEDGSIGPCSTTHDAALWTCKTAPLPTVGATRE